MKAPLAARPVLANPFPHASNEEYGLYFANAFSYTVPSAGWNGPHQYPFWVISIASQLPIGLRVGRKEIGLPSQAVALYAPNIKYEEFLEKGSLRCPSWLMFRVNDRRSPLRKITGHKGYGLFEDPGMLIRTLIGQICACFLNPTTGADLFVRGIFYQILALLQSAKSEKGKPMRHISLANLQLRPREKSLRSQVENHLRAHPGTHITVAEMARHLKLGLSSFTHHYHEKTGETFSQTKARVRIEEAKSLLLKGDMSIKQVALELGFFDIAHFSNIFRRVVGTSPSHFVKELAPRFSDHLPSK